MLYLDLTVNYPTIDFVLRNKRGFNVLHHAALKGDNRWVAQFVNTVQSLYNAIFRPDGELSYNRLNTEEQERV